jgi:YHS domain-containing protein
MKLWRLVIVGLISLSLLALIGCGKSEEQPAEEPEQEAEMTETAVMVVDHTPAGEELGMEVTCPVCGMAMTVEEGTLAAEYDGEIYYFCNVADKDAFAADPEAYMAESEEGEGAEEMESEEETGH